MNVLFHEDMPKPTGEPTRVGEDGQLRPGAVDPRAPVNKQKIAEADAATAQLVDSRDGNNRYSSSNPHLIEPYSSLEMLSFQALRRYGDMHPGSVDGEVKLMFVEFANLVIEELRSHPYWSAPDIDYYTHPSETRPIPDAIMVAGLLYHYAMQQQSNKIEVYAPLYFKTTNRVLFSRKYGSGPIEMSPVDRGVGNRPENGAVGYDARRSR